MCPKAWKQYILDYNLRTFHPIKLTGLYFYLRLKWKFRHYIVPEDSAAVCLGKEHKVRA